HLPPVVELAIVNLTRHDGGDGRTNAIQIHQLSPFLFGCCARRRSLVAFSFEGRDLLLYERQPRDLPHDLTRKTRRYWMTIPSDKLVDIQPLVLSLHIDPADTLGEQQSL